MVKVNVRLDMDSVLVCKGDGEKSYHLGCRNWGGGEEVLTDRFAGFPVIDEPHHRHRICYSYSLARLAELQANQSQGDMW